MEFHNRIIWFKRYVQMNTWTSTAFLCSWCVVLFALSSVPGNHYPQVSWAFADKLVHISLYMLLGIFAWFFFKQRNRGILSALTFSIIYGLSDELHQVWVPRRSASFADVVADAVGASIGLIIVCLISYYQTYRRKPEMVILSKPSERMGMS